MAVGGVERGDPDFRGDGRVGKRVAEPLGLQLETAVGHRAESHLAVRERNGEEGSVAGVELIAPVHAEADCGGIIDEETLLSAPYGV